MKEETKAGTERSWIEVRPKPPNFLGIFIFNLLVTLRALMLRSLDTAIAMLLSKRVAC